MTRVAVGWRAQEALRRELQPGEDVVACAEVTSDPSRWALAAVLAGALAMTAAGLEELFGRYRSRVLASALPGPCWRWAASCFPARLMSR